ncbi:MAG: thiamine-phosphate kinase [Rikenellaceae bacterium]
MDKKKRTEISELGQFKLVERLTSGFKNSRPSTLMGVGDDAAVLDIGNGEVLLTTSDMLLEGVDFDLTYFPLKHLGYKAVVVGINDILAMNGRPEQVTISLGVSSKLPVEALEDLYEGIRVACEEYNVDLVGGDTRASMTGLVISISAVGRARKGAVAYRSGAQKNDMICITGNLGAAYMGLHLLEREKRVLQSVDNPQPQFEGYEYLLQSYLKPEARINIIESLAEESIVPTAMIDLSDGLASDLLQICKASNCGARIYLERIPIAKQTTALATELNSDQVVAALNGGEDHELMFTLPLEMQESVAKLGCIDIIGHITEQKTGAFLVTPDGAEIALRSQGFPNGLEL